MSLSGDFCPSDLRPYFFQEAPKSPHLLLLPPAAFGSPRQPGPSLGRACGLPLTEVLSSRGRGRQQGRLQHRPSALLASISEDTAALTFHRCGN